jgi:hypothetical protein
MTQYVDEDFVNRQKDLRPIGFMVRLDQYKKYENIAREAAGNYILPRILLVALSSRKKVLKYYLGSKPIK